MKKTQWFLACLILPIFWIFSNNSSAPFSHDLHLSTIKGQNEEVMVCFHGMGGDYTIANFLHETHATQDTLIGFNFPDYGIKRSAYDPHKSSFGTISEILPPLYILRKLIVEEGRNKVNLYGYSAGGGAIINLIAALNTHQFDLELTKINIFEPEKKRILDVLQKGKIILDTPLKSIEEIIAFRGRSEELDTIRQHYEENGMEPIKVLQKLNNLSLNVLVHFQVPDEILSNRDDDLFIQTLKQVNEKGKTWVVIGTDSGHKLPHPSLWNFYKSLP